MIRAYLEKIKVQLSDEINELEKRKITLEHSIIENEKFMELLDEGNDPYFESFTPRTVNSRNKEKISELDQQKKMLISEKDEIVKRIATVTEKLEECKKTLQYECEQERIKREAESHFSLPKNIEEKLTNAVRKLQFSLEIIDMDTQRCHLEVSDAIKIIENIISETDDE